MYCVHCLLVCAHLRFSGIYFYNSHPIYKVDVLGTVVYKRERNDFFCYGGAVSRVWFFTDIPADTNKVQFVFMHVLLLAYYFQ